MFGVIDNPNAPGWTALTLLIPLAAIALAFVAHRRALPPFSRAPRVGVGPALVAGGVLFLLAEALMGWIVAAHYPPPKPTAEEVAMGEWLSARHEVWDSAQGSRHGFGAYSKSVSFRDVRVYRHAAALTNPDHPEETIGNHVVCGEATDSDSPSAPYRFVVAGTYHKYGDDAATSPLCAGEVAYVPPDVGRGN